MGLTLLLGLSWSWDPSRCRDIMRHCNKTGSDADLPSAHDLNSWPRATSSHTRQCDCSPEYEA
jgi:hypothetical protein